MEKLFTRIMWPEFLRHSGKLFSPRAKSAKEEVKQRQRGNKKEERFSFKDFLRHISEPRRTRKSAGRILRVVSLFIYSCEERHDTRVLLWACASASVTPVQ